MPPQSCDVPGLVEAVPAGSEADHFVRVHKRDPENGDKDGLEEHV